MKDDGNNFNDKINIELVKLQDELNALDAAVKHIEKAGEISNDVLAAIDKIQNKYNETLTYLNEQFENHLKDTTEKTKDEIKEVSNSHKQQIDDIQKLLDNYLELAEATARLPKEIEKVDFPARLDRIDDEIKNIQDGILNTQKQVDTVSENVNKIYTDFSDINSKAERNRKKMNSIQTVSIISLILLAALLALQFFPELI